MISNGALELLKKLVDKYNSTNNTIFDTFECLPCKDFNKKVIELHNAGLIEYSDSHIFDMVKLTRDGIKYKF